MIFRPGLARSAGVVIRAGFDVGTITVSSLRANTTGSPVVRPFVTSFAGFVVSAERKTSAGAPCSI